MRMTFSPPSLFNSGYFRHHQGRTMFRVYFNLHTHPPHFPSYISVKVLKQAFYYNNIRAEPMDEKGGNYQTEF